METYTREIDSDIPLFRMNNISVTYPGAKPDLGTLAVDNINLEIQRGEFVSFVGPSGCGKSTLLSAVSGLLTGYQGDVFINDQKVDGPHPDIGVVFQEESTFPWRSVLRNVEFGLEMRGDDKTSRRSKSHSALEMVGLSNFSDSFPSELSGGMKQRVAIARTLVTEPEILLLDEPFGALDEQTRIMLGDELLKIQRHLDQTVMLITHNIQEAALLSNRVVILSARPGRIKEIVDIDLPRVRDSSLIASKQFAELTGRIWSTLREESLEAFDQQNTKEQTHA